MKLLIVDELNTVAKTVMGLAPPTGESPHGMKNNDTPINSKEYWIKIFNDHKTVVCQSELTRYADLPLHDKHSGYTVRTIISKERLRLHQDKKNEVTFRVRRIRVPVQSATYVVQIGKPIEKLDGECLDLKEINLAELLKSVLGDYEVVFISKFLFDNTFKK